MGNKGESKSEKRLAASRVIPVKRKSHVWHVRARAGPHKKRNSAALAFVLRNMLNVVKNAKEARQLLNEGMVLVDGRIVKDPKRPVGLFDLVKIVPEKKAYRIVFSKRRKLAATEEKFGENWKICKVVGKKAVEKNVFQIATNDGRTIKEKKSEATLGDSILIEVPSQKLEKVLKQETGKTVFIVDGTHIGQVAKIKGIVQGTMKRPRLLTLETSEGEFSTVEANAVVVGNEKPLIKVE